MTSTTTETIAAEDYQRIAAFRHAVRRFLAFSADAARDAGLTPHQHQALLSIKAGTARGTFTIGQLADHLLVAPQTAAELVARLDDEGLVRKVVDTEDRRRVSLRLTERAERILERLTGSHLAEIRGTAPELIATLEALLSRDWEAGR